MTALPPPRRIVTSNLPIPLIFTLSSAKNAQPAVQVISEALSSIPELGGQASRSTVFTHESIPTSNSGLDIKPLEIPGGGIVLLQGANIRFNDLAPGGRVPMHRSSTTDYNIFFHGSAILLTPASAFDPSETGKAKLVKTVCNPGDVVMQRGTLHAWENRSQEWVRWIVVILGAEPTAVDIEGSEGVKRLLSDCFDV